MNILKNLDFIKAIKEQKYEEAYNIFFIPNSPPCKMFSILQSIISHLLSNLKYDFSFLILFYLQLMQ